MAAGQAAAKAPGLSQVLVDGTYLVSPRISRPQLANSHLAKLAIPPYKDLSDTVRGLIGNGADLALYGGENAVPVRYSGRFSPELATGIPASVQRCLPIGFFNDFSSPVWMDDPAKINDIGYLADVVSKFELAGGRLVKMQMVAADSFNPGMNFALIFALIFPVPVNYSRPDFSPFQIEYRMPKDKPPIRA